MHVDSIGRGLRRWHPNCDRPNVCEWRSWLLWCYLSILPGCDYSKLSPLEKLHRHSWIHRHLLFTVDDDFCTEVSANLRADSSANSRTDSRTDPSANTRTSGLVFRDPVDLLRQRVEG